MGHHLTTCTFCGAGCGLYLETAGGQVVGTSPSLEHPSSAGRLCARGWHVHEIAGAPDRLRRPLVRRGGALVEASWDEALGLVADRLASIRARHGPGAIAFLASPRCANEDAYLLQKLARAVIGTPHVDHGAGVYGHNSLEVLLGTLGVAAATNPLSDLDRSEVILVDGVDLAREMPTVAGRVLRAKLRGARLVVVAERRHLLAEHADLFLQLRPGTEAVLYAALAKVIVDRGLVDEAFVRARCRGARPFLEAVRAIDLLAAARRCGVGPALLEAAALAYARPRAAAALYSTAGEGRGPQATAALVDLVLLTGHLGRPGAGLYPLAEHNNLQGVCDMGLLPDRLPGYRAVGSAGARAALARRWGAAPPAEAGLPAAAVLGDRGRGAIRAIWLSRYDPVSTAPVDDAAAALDACELVVVQHLFLTETARHAHVVLPTCAFGEERVTFTSTERRIQLAEQALAPPPGVVPAWEQVAALARALGAPWRYGSSAEVLAEIAEVIPEYSGVRQEVLAREWGRPWPCTLDRPLGTPTLFAPEDAAPGAPPPFRFAPLDPWAAEAPEDPERPLTLVFGHSHYYWNQSVLVQHSETLRREYRTLLLDYPEGFVELHPDDARAAGVRDGQRIRLCAEGGAAVTTARVTPEVRPGSVFVPFFVRQVQQAVRGAGRALAARVPVRVEREAT